MGARWKLAADQRRRRLSLLRREDFFEVGNHIVFVWIATFPQQNGTLLVKNGFTEFQQSILIIFFSGDGIECTGFQERTPFRKRFGQ